MFSILIVEDDRLTGRALARLCRHSGYDPAIASNGVDATQLFEISQPDLIILDYMLPEMNGLEVLMRIRATNRSVPVIIFTANDDPEVRRQFLAAGATDFWLKASVTVPQILDRIARHLKNRPVLIPPTNLSIPTLPTSREYASPPQFSAAA
jgi:CheY-like chemotaxis protein